MTSTGGNSSPQPSDLGALLAFLGTVADHAAGGRPEDGARIASLAVALGRVAERPAAEIDALYYAARLRNAGLFGNPAFSRTDVLPPRFAQSARWDIPPEGARLCERLAVLPAGTADIVRWQAERWDGTGFPDQLRWGGIPCAAQLLAIATRYASIEDPEEALLQITTEGGRGFAPENVRSFVMWFHTAGGEIELANPPALSGADAGLDREAIVTLLAERVDTHTATPSRSARVAACAQAIVRHLCGTDEAVHRTQLAGLLFGLGELGEEALENERFDPLGRLAIERRSRYAGTAAALIAACEPLRAIAPIVGARAEWYDGTGKPKGLRHDEIPLETQALALAIAYDALEENYRERIGEDRTLPIARIENGAGTQFDPRAVRALAEVVKARV